MEFKELGKTGVTIPEIGLGTWQYEGGVEPIRKGIELGAFHIDTAENYGTEEAVGEAIGGQREKVFLATKVSGGHLRYDEVLAAAEGSLRRLGTDFIDLYQIHWPNPSVPIKDTMRAMEDLADSGKVRFIGVSNFSVKGMQEAQDYLARHRIVSNQVKYSLFDRGIEEELLPYCEANDITVIAYSSLARGQLTSKPLLWQRRAIGILQRIASESGKTMAQLALNWSVARPKVVTIPKSDKVERVIENCAASGWRLSREQMEVLNKAFS
ncbi:MAG: aldo/keto reductase [Candidatus Binatia bacterium]|jgi:diketogulonate reductase-like aldo/keto reductase|nr:aldo/keto reductase [Candidatus Binatia bacterium]|tara:strand:- start:372 stop:1175 length:804 start_codon:yes stop_codon:yes gene_type:complete